MIYVLSGGSRLHAVIAVTYPEGSVCTCSDGKKTLKAKDTSGKALFNVSAGEWTVTVTDGNKTKSATVSITQEAQSESVTLSYWNGELYYKGDEFPDVTGGWTGTNPSSYFNTGTVTKNADNIKVSIGAMQSIFAHTVNKISLTNVNTIYAKIVSASNTNTDKIITVFAVGTKIGTNYAAVFGISNGQSGYVSIDVSNLTGDYYVYFHVSSETNSAQITFDEVYME